MANGNAVTKYAGAFEYDANNVVKSVAITDGQAIVNSNYIAFQYYHKDQLGNVRNVIDEDGNTQQRTDYYPFGLEITRQGSDNKYLYNSKEKQIGTGFLDYGARLYDAVVPHFLTNDELAEKYSFVSPYAYVANNPLNAIDTDGRQIYFLVRNEDGSIREKLKYRNGNFFHENSKRYNPGEEAISKTLFAISEVYRSIENSDNDILKNQLHTLMNSDKNHYIEEIKKGDSNVSALNNEDDYFAYVGKSASTKSYFNFYNKDKKFNKSDSQYTITHEMRYQFDFDIGNMKDKVRSSSEIDPEVIRAVYNGNLGNNLIGKKPVNTYGGKLIDPKKLINPPNNLQKKKC